MSLSDQSPLPTGTVSFLFTDVAGSTAVWERSPAGMNLALGRHDEIVRSSIAEFGGSVFATGGDAFSAVFSRAVDAILSAVSAQRALVAEPRPDSTPVRVRMGLHTGESFERGGDYFGPAVNRAAST